MAEARRNQLGYAYYIDGNLVDKELIDPSLYSGITYDDENKIVYIATSR